MAAPRILWRAILRDTLVHLTLGLAVFTLLIVVQNVLRFMERLLGAGITLAELGALIGIILPSYAVYAIPTSLLFGVLLTFGRMSADGEIIAIRASGVSVPRLLPPVIALGLIAALASGWLLFEVEPRSHRNLKILVRQLSGAIGVIQPGEFRELGEQTLYVHALGDEACPLRGVLIGDFSRADRSLYIAARCGSVRTEEVETATLSLELVEGSIHTAEAGGDRYRRISFAKMQTGVDLSRYLNPGRRVRHHTFAELLELERRVARGESPELRGSAEPHRLRLEVHRRLAFPLASLVLALLAVPLGIRPLRTGRSWGALTAVAVMALYWCLFSVGELAAKARLVPPWPAIWSANFLLAVLAIHLLRRTSRTDT